MAKCIQLCRDCADIVSCLPTICLETVHSVARSADSVLTYVRLVLLNVINLTWICVSNVQKYVAYALKNVAKCIDDEAKVVSQKLPQNYILSRRKGYKIDL